MKSILKLGTACVVLTAILSGCNTVAGLGRDVERAGEKVQEVARKK
jgi:predicted small secreted protein